MDRLIMPALVVGAFIFCIWAVMRTDAPDTSGQSGFQAIVQTGSPTPAPVSSASTSSATKPPFYGNLQTAIRVSHSQRKPLVVVFSTTWCGACHKFIDVVCPSEQVRPYYDRYIWAHVDLENSDVREFHDKYADLKAIHYVPTIAYFNPDGGLLKCHTSVYADKFAQNLDEVLRSVNK